MEVSHNWYWSSLLNCRGTEKPFRVRVPVLPFYMANYNFRKDLEEAKGIEKEFAGKFGSRFHLLGVEYNDDYRYDVKFKTANGSFTFEVKHDIMSSKTGNLALEYECRGRDSGISKTEASYWAYKLDNDFYWIKVADLKSLVTDKKYFRKVIGGDSGSNTKMYLFKLDVIKGCMTKL